MLFIIIFYISIPCSKCLYTMISRQRFGWALSNVTALHFHNRIGDRSGNICYIAVGQDFHNANSMCACKSAIHKHRLYDHNVTQIYWKPTTNTHELSVCITNSSSVFIQGNSQSVSSGLDKDYCKTRRENSLGFFLDLMRLTLEVWRQARPGISYELTARVSFSDPAQNGHSVMRQKLTSTTSLLFPNLLQPLFLFLSVASDWLAAQPQDHKKPC